MTSLTISTASRSTSRVVGESVEPDRITTRAAVRRGRVTVKQEPRPSALSARMSPPCHSTIDLQMASPRPLPP